jgi:hypothetical protein
VENSPEDSDDSDGSSDIEGDGSSDKEGPQSKLQRGPSSCTLQRDRLSELAARQAKALLLEGGRVATKVAPVEGGDAQNQVPNEIIELHFKAWLQSALTLL